MTTFSDNNVMHNVIQRSLPEIIWLLSIHEFILCRDLKLLSSRLSRFMYLANIKERTSDENKYYHSFKPVVRSFVFLEIVFKEVS